MGDEKSYASLEEFVNNNREWVKGCVAAQEVNGRRLNQHLFGDGDGSEPVRHPMQRIIEDDTERFRRTVNHPEPLRPHVFGDGSGLRAHVYEVGEGQRAAYFRDIPTGEAFYDASGGEWRKADEQWAVRVGDGANMPFPADAVFKVADRTREEGK